MVQIIKCFASLPDKTELYRSQHNKAPYPRWLEYKVPSSAVLQIFGHRDLQINYSVFFFFLCFLCGQENKETFPESSLLMPPLPVLRFTLWYPTYIRKQLWGGKKKKKRLTAFNMVPPSTGRHTKLNKRENILIIL